MSESSTVPGETERWLAIPDWEGWYEVSDKGRVCSLDRQVTITMPGGWKTASGATVRTYRGRILKQDLNRYGYPCVKLSRPGQRKGFQVHALVARAFIGPCPDGQEVRHGPAGKLDASLPNLCYGTRKENFADRLRDGQDNRGEKHGNAKLTQALVDEIRARYAAGERQIDIAESLRVDPANLWCVVHNKSWSYS
jgi:hypothetical protein